MATRIQIRRDTSANWEANNPVLALGEPGLETDTFIVKYGDGSTAWNSLEYANLDSLADFTTANLAEYSANLYYTNARVYANILTLGHATNAQLASYATNAQINALTTASITESGNLYFTNARVTSALTSNTANVTFGNVIRLVNYTYDEMQALAGAEKGWIIFETSNNVFRGYNGTAWSNLG